MHWVFSPPRWFPGTAHLTLKVEPKKEGRRDWAEAAVCVGGGGGCGSGSFQDRPRSTGGRSWCISSTADRDAWPSGTETGVPQEISQAKP